MHAIEARHELRSTLAMLVGVALLALAGVLALRYGVMESAAVALQCTGEVPAWWCGGRSALGLFIHYQVFGWAALLLAALAWTVRARGVVWLALAAAIVALMLYNTGLGAVALVPALLRALRP